MNREIPLSMKSPHATLVPVLALALIVVATTLRPGDAPWIADEPLLLYGAMYCNTTASHLWKIRLPFTAAPYGLIGTRGVHYGPLAIWLDQIFLAFTHNPIIMIAIRAAAFSAITAAALYWLAKTLRVTPWLAVAVMLSPWLWLYSRQLWDNSLCIPLCAMLFAAYADFVLTHRPWSLRLAALVRHAPAADPSDGRRPHRRHRPAPGPFRIPFPLAIQMEHRGDPRNRRRHILAVLVGPSA